MQVAFNLYIFKLIKSWNISILRDVKDKEKKMT